MYEPVIKWSGSKRSQAEEILKYFPKEIDTYYEPFCGGASMLRRLLDADIKVNKYVCSDLNKDLIDLFNLIKTQPYQVSEHYRELWNKLNIDDDKERKKNFFNEIRDKLNKEHNPLDFMFIMRTTTNGMPRYNAKGEFNNSFHITRDGINPDTLKNIIYEWSHLLNDNNVEFINCSYEKIKPNKNDFLYLDPPYYNTKGMYYGRIDYDEFFDYLRNIPCNYILSFDGISGDKNSTVSIPNDVYSKQEYIKNGNSSFKRVIGNSKDSIVYESIYIK
jgi:DNA adenine methylase